MTKRDLTYFMSLSYPYELSRDEEEEGYFAAHPDLPGCMAEGATADEAVENLDAARELWIETRLENGYAVPEPIGDEYSGRVSLRMTPTLHQRLAKLAQREKMSLNSLINYALASFAGASEAASDLGSELQEIKELLEALALHGNEKRRHPIASPQPSLMNTRNVMS